MFRLSRLEDSKIVAAMSVHCVIGRMYGDEDEEASVKYILCVCSKLCEIKLLTLRSSYFTELVDLADIIIGLLMAFIKQLHWFN